LKSLTLLQPLIFTRPLASRGVPNCLSNCAIYLDWTYF